MKKLLCLLLLFCLFVPAMAETTENSNAFVFRNGIQFGMTMDQVEPLVMEQLINAGLGDESEVYREEITPEDWGLDAYSGMIGTELDEALDTTGYFFGTDETKGLIEIIYIVKDLTGAAAGMPLADYTGSWDERTELDYQMMDAALTEKYGAAKESAMIISPYWQYTLNEWDDRGLYSEMPLARITHRLVRLEDGKAILIEHIGLNVNYYYGYNVVSYMEISETEYEYRMKMKNIQDYLKNML